MFISEFHGKEISEINSAQQNNLGKLAKNTKTFNEIKRKLLKGGKAERLLMYLTGQPHAQ